MGKNKDKKKDKRSDREKWADETGRPKSEYPGDSKNKKKDKDKDSKDEKKSKEKIEDYYGGKEESVEKRAEVDTSRLKEDIEQILKDAGIAQTRATEDYLRNIENIQANKAADVDDINYYVQTQAGRTQEDLDTALAKESRRYSIEYDRINEDLASRGLTFSERKDERIAQEGSAETVAGIQTEAQRSFADIARYEAAKNRDIQLKYGQLEEETGVSKTRNLEDILNDQQKATKEANRRIEDVAFGKEENLTDISYGRDTDVALIDQMFSQDNLQQRLRNEQRSA